MAKQRQMTEVSVKELMEQYNLIVPEIQREYVWGQNPQNILEAFLQDIKDGYNTNAAIGDEASGSIKLITSLLEKADQVAKNSLLELMGTLSAKSNMMNIGFLYSYEPDYYVFNDVGKDVYLIDGQQRFTTLFLLLFYLSIRENQKEDFRELFRFDLDSEHIAFDYRVRTLTHNFFIDLVEKTSTVEDLLNLRHKNWFLSDYSHDVTIKSIVGTNKKEDKGVLNGTFPLIHESFKDESATYYDYVKNNIRFWHFKTEETSQGEELYITMNSRGQQLEDNENIRAKLFEGIDPGQKLHWSAKWEEWQDFFWKKRNRKSSSSSADKGFNEFLRWIAIIELIKEGKGLDTITSPVFLRSLIKADDMVKIPVQSLTFEKIERYIKAVQCIFVELKDHTEDFSLEYEGYTNFQLIPDEWLSPPDNNISQNHLFRLLPVLHYTTTLQAAGTIDYQQLFRVVRFFFNLSRDTTVTKTPDVQLLNAVHMVSEMNGNPDIISVLGKEGISKSLLNKEETLKLGYFKSSPSRAGLESLFWRAEDMKINDGKISHLVMLGERLALHRTVVFSVATFSDVLQSYKELIDNEDLVFGNFINTDVYYASGDRVISSDAWFRKDGFLDGVFDRALAPAIDLDKLFEKKQKEFIRTYTTADLLFNETDSKVQLYLYFILNTRIVGDWQWNDNWNFGIYGDNNDKSIRSIFSDNKIYQKYNLQWRYSYGYNAANGIWTQHNGKPKVNYLTALYDWANPVI